MRSSKASKWAQTRLSDRKKELDEKWVPKKGLSLASKENCRFLSFDKYAAKPFRFSCRTCAGCPEFLDEAEIEALPTEQRGEETKANQCACDAPSLEVAHVVARQDTASKMLRARGLLDFDFDLKSKDNAMGHRTSNLLEAALRLVLERKIRGIMWLLSKISPREVLVKSPDSESAILWATQVHRTMLAGGRHTSCGGTGAGVGE
ncbi:hypothetical protein ASPWEDRAFT_173355 [Aspergillus wentii DTO 134E9]|uniref:Uncharacterized protein n=1 Tax=Aspergillus wentii DTO 134E9 TaxID=1073089 RepID=A0A1L9RG66_ASPWE|nr:uncharacterized protein ASPWEDRAFT_173355 [Aspergillus wentii DTO 134E9]KAI9927710.1 hypothetical protein MW887_002562 [Aspergillus wentii]OJJ33922.1 hypothetical protein ASPWEDRAFT_173355 [Aspergillus wentii DTO 134E9]